MTGDDAAAAGYHVRSGALEKLIVLASFLPGDDKQAGVQLPCGHNNGEVIDIITGGGYDSFSISDAGFFQGMCLGTPPEYGVLVSRQPVGVYINDGDRQAAFFQLFNRSCTETTGAADYPGAGGWTRSSS